VARLASTTPIHKQVLPEGCHPVKFGYTNVVRTEQYMQEIELICRQLWTYLGYAGLGTLWADDGRSPIILAKNQDKLKRFFWYMDDIDVDWRSYCYLALPLVSYESWQRLLLLVNNKQHWHWMSKLREHVGASEDIDELAEFILEFIQRQVDLYGSAKVRTSSSIQSVPGAPQGKAYRSQYYAVYTLLADRLKQFKAQGVDPLMWLDIKMEKAKGLDYIYLSTIVNHNGLDPDVNELQSVVNDEWRSVRNFIGLSRACKFPDGCIPAGWWPSGDDVNNLWDISAVTRDGFYYYSSGEQRRGKFFYMKNRYHVIGCTPDNFEQFKAGWRDVRMLTSKPTWEEYSRYAVYPDMWDERGESINGRIPNVSWRRN